MAEEIRNQEPEQVAEDQLALEPIKPVPGMQTMWNNPKLMNQSFRMANMISRSGLVPENYRNSPENCLIAIDIGNRMGMSPMMVMQNLYVVKGKPAWSGSFCAGVINGSGRFSPLEYQMVGEPGKLNYGCRAVARRLSDGVLCSGGLVTMQTAQDEGWLNKPGSKWKTMPEQMLKYRTSVFFARTYCPEALMGLYTTDEMRDIKGNEDASETKTIKLEG